MSNLRDPRSDTSAGLSNPLTGTATSGGFGDGAGVDLGNGVIAALNITATRNKTSVNASGTTVQVLAANIQRYAVTIVNNETTKTIYIGLGVAAVVGTNPVLPGKSYNVPPGKVTGAINAIWAAGGSVALTALETVA